MVSQPYLNQTKFFSSPGEFPGSILQCYDITVLSGGPAGIWQEINPAENALPALMMQLIIITSLNRFLGFLIRPLRQPRIVAEIIAGILLGPSFMGKLKRHCAFLDAVFSVSGVMTLEAMGNIGLVYYLFLIGLEIDLNKATRVGQKPLCIALVGTVFPFIVGILLYYFLLPDIGKTFQMGCLFWGVALTDSSLSVTTQILAKLKLLYTDIGKTYISSAVANEMISWIFLTVLLSIGSDLRTAPQAFFSTVAFLAFLLFVIRPVMIKLINRVQKKGPLNEQTICIILTTVLACGLITDFLGTTSIIGAFAFGLIIPTGLLGPKFVEVHRGFVDDLLMPIFFATSGFRTNLDSVGNGLTWVLMVLIVVLAYSCKFLTSLIVSLFYDTRLKEGLALGVLMNTKGLLPIIVLNFGRDYRVMDDLAFSILLMAILVMTMVTEPAISLLYRPKNLFFPNSNRSIQKLIPGSKLKVVACIHDLQAVSGIINLLEASNPSITSPLAIFALHLVQLTSHTSALLLIHGSDSAQINQINEAFNKFEEEHCFTSVEQQTIVSPYSTMHLDICSISEQKRASLILIPFHKRQTLHENLENMSQDYKDVNDKLLAKAPCSVGIFVDRGFMRLQKSDAEGEMATHNIAMVYLGGPDDREALSYARKMAAHPNTALTVVRFVESKRLIDLIDNSGNLEGMNKKIAYRSEQKLIDDRFLEVFREEIEDDDSIVYMEKEASNGADIIGVLRVLVECYDLFVVGRGVGIYSPLKAGLEEGSECPELGPIGDILVTSSFSSGVSVLVVQQYKEPKPRDKRIRK